MKIIKSTHDIKHFGDKGFIYGEVQDATSTKQFKHDLASIGSSGSIAEIHAIHAKHKIVTIPQLTKNKIALPLAWTNHSTTVDINTSIGATRISIPDSKEFIGWLKIIRTYREICESLVYLPWTVRFADLGTNKVNKLLDQNFYLVTSPHTMVSEDLHVNLSEFIWYAKFKYNDSLVEGLKTHANQRQWHPDVKCWSFVAKDDTEIHDLCTKLIHTVSLTLLNICLLQFSQNRVVWKAWSEF